MAATGDKPYRFPFLENTAKKTIYYWFSIERKDLNGFEFKHTTVPTVLAPPTVVTVLADHVFVGVEAGTVVGEERGHGLFVDSATPATGL